MSKQFYSSKEGFSEVLTNLAASMPPEGLTLRQILERLQDRGLLMLCMVLTVPFLLPVSIPGTSTPFGLVIAFIGLGILANKPPCLPGYFVDRPIAAESLLPVLEKGAQLFNKIERWTHPRLPILTHGKTFGRLNGILLVLSAILLMAPLPLPLANALPAYGILFLAAGSLERDGYMVLVGYLMMVLTIIYFALVALLGAFGLQALFSF